MNYVKSVITNFLALVVIFFSTEIGNRYRFFTRQSAPDMGAARFLVTLVFLVSCISFFSYYYPAAKKRAEKYTAIDQKILQGYIKRSAVIFVIGALAVLGLSVINGIAVLFGNGGYFSTALVIFTIIVYAGLYVVAMKYFQPKGIYLRTNAKR